MNDEVNVKAIVESCRLENLHPCDNGWRSTSPFRDKDSDAGDLSISADGAYKCHATNSTGHVVELFAHCTSQTVIEARRQLKGDGLLPRRFTGLITNPKELEKVGEDQRNGNKVAGLMAQCELHTVTDWTQVAEWRKISLSTIQQAAALQTLKYAKQYDSWRDPCYVFIASEPPVRGEPPHVKGAMFRVKNDKKSWITISTYPIWVPWWVPDAKNVMLMEGHWDALAMADWLNLLPPDTQPMGLVGGKDIYKYREIMKYFEGKKVFVCPDDDKAGDGILTRTLDALTGIDCQIRLLRIPPATGQKDFNDWMKLGISEEAFKGWIEGAEEIEVKSNGKVTVVVDARYCQEHGVKKGDFFLIDQDGKPKKVQVSKLVGETPYQMNELYDITRPYPLLNDYLYEATEHQEAPPLWHLMSFLTYFGGAVGRRIHFVGGSMGCLYPMLYTMLVGSSGLGKNQSMNILRPIIASVSPKDEKEAWAYLGESRFSGDSLLYELSKCNHKQFVLYEASEWMPKDERSIKNDALKALINMHDCEQYNDDHPFITKYMKGSYVIKRPAVSLLTACVPEQMQAVDRDVFTGGMIGRFVFALGTRKHHLKPMLGGISPAMAQRCESFFKSVFTTPFVASRTIHLSTMAQIHYEKEYYRNEDYIETIKFSDQAVSYFSRWRVRVFKIAMSLQLLSDNVQWPLDQPNYYIRDETLYTAIKLVQILDRCFLRTFKYAMEATELSKDGRIQRRIMKFMNEHACKEGVQKSAIYRFIQEGEYALNSNINVLIDSGQIIKHVEKTRSKSKEMFFLPEPERRVSDV